jgi:hypothetical protein
VKQFFERLDRLATNALGQSLLPGVDRDRRAAVRDVAAAAAIAAGRRQVLDEVRRTAREIALARFGSRVFRPTWVGLNWGQSLGTVEDRVALAEIFDDAAIGAVAGDLVDEDVAADLWSGLEVLETSAEHGPPEQSFELVLRRAGSPIALALLLLAGGVGLAVGSAQFSAALVALLAGAMVLMQRRRRTGQNADDGELVRNNEKG